MVSIYPGRQCTLRVSYTPSNTTDDKTVKWSSSNEAIATVNSNGVVTGQALGKATITATVGACSRGCTVTVVKRPIPVEAINIRDTLSMKVGDTAQITANYVPANADTDTNIQTADQIEWFSDNTNIVTVNKGKVTAKREGTVIVKAAYGDFIDKCVVTVTAASTPSPTRKPTAAPTKTPVIRPMASPTKTPTAIPTRTPAILPTAVPTKEPQISPPVIPTSAPTKSPAAIPTGTPTEKPMTQPTQKPDEMCPAASPSDMPSGTWPFTDVVIKEAGNTRISNSLTRKMS